MSKLFYIYFGYLSAIATFLTLVVALIKNKTLVKKMRVLLLYVFIAAFTEIVSYVLTKLGIHNLFLINAFTIIEFTLLSLFYKEVFTQKKYSFIIYLFLLCFYSLSFYNFIFLNETNDIDIFTVMIESFLLIMFSLFYFYELIKKIEYVNIFQNPLFWINSSVLIYFSGNLFLFIFSNYILKYPDSRIWFLHNALNLIYNTLLIISFWKTSKK